MWDDDFYDGEEREGGKEVHCQVEVISWRERRIKAEISVNTDIESVWNALTDYERLSDFVPNLVSSGRIPCPHPGRIWLEQRGLQRALYWHIEARVVLDLQEFLNSATDRELHFSMVDGDFKKFEGKWSLKSGTRSSTTILSYEVNVIPRFNFPAIFLERIIRSDLPVNLKALACRAKRNFEGIQKVAFAENNLHKSSMVTGSLHTKINGALHEKDKLLAGESKESVAGSNLPPSTSELNSNWGVFGKVCKLDRPRMVDEVHLRRFDGLLENGGVHRCVVASITVKAPVREVWNVLTAYESLPEIVPNLAISKILSRENNKVRILQEGCKGLLYMLLWKRSYMKIYHPTCVRFETTLKKGKQHMLWKHVTKLEIHHNKLFHLALTETMIIMPLKESLDYNVQSSSKQRPRVPGLQRDIEVLKSELLKFIADHGQEGFMPMRKQLRLHGRVDIEKAIARMGGFRRIATIMNLSLAYKHRKPKGYWDNLENLEEEISRFQRSWGMDLSFMPSRKSFERAGRYDIARALEKWGGLHEVSRLLSLKMRHPNRQGNPAKDKKIDCVESTVVENDKKIQSEPYVSQDTHKWLTKLKQLDIDWVD
ncbi:Cyclase/dehydrase family protein [Quillaja saponaria]|uniref:Cyclase/dehydrase family protein n=1 Tax=Quillaja saponaria TaxID=32244 RepID=A0AAD7LF93_QUISA|nr:Cyclase/dehydrase family protein [Quillaja saponaria]